MSHDYDKFIDTINVIILSIAYLIHTVIRLICTHTYTITHYIHEVKINKFVKQPSNRSLNECSRGLKLEIKL